MVSYKCLSFLLLSLLPKALSETIGLPTCADPGEPINGFYTCKIGNNYLSEDKFCIYNGKIYKNSSTAGECTIMYGNNDYDEGIHVFDVKTNDQAIEITSFTSEITNKDAVVIYDCAYGSCKQTVGYVMSGIEIIECKYDSSGEDFSSSDYTSIAQNTNNNICDSTTGISDTGKVKYTPAVTSRKRTSKPAFEVCVIKEVKIEGNDINEAVKNEVNLKNVGINQYYHIKGSQEFAGFPYSNMALLKTEGNNIVALSVHNLRLPSCDNAGAVDSECKVGIETLADDLACIDDDGKIYKSRGKSCTLVYGGEDTEEGVYIFQKKGSFNKYQDVTNNLSTVSLDSDEINPFMAIYDCSVDGCVQTSGYVKYGSDNYVSCYTQKNKNSIKWTNGCIKLNKDGTIGDAVECNDKKGEVGSYKYNTNTNEFEICYNIGQDYQYIKMNQSKENYFAFKSYGTPFPDTVDNENVLVKINQNYVILDREPTSGYYINGGSIYTNDDDLGKDALIYCNNNEYDECIVKDVRTNASNNGFYVNEGSDKSTNPIIKCDHESESSKCVSITPPSNGYYKNKGNTDPLILCVDNECSTVQSSSEGGDYINIGDTTSYPVIKCTGTSGCTDIATNVLKSSCSSPGDIVKKVNTYYICTSSTDKIEISLDDNYKYSVIDTGSINPFTNANLSVNKLLKSAYGGISIVSYNVEQNNVYYAYVDTGLEANEDIYNIDISESILKYEIKQQNNELEILKSCKFNSYKNPELYMSSSCEDRYYLISNDEIITNENIESCNIQRKCVLVCKKDGCTAGDVDGYINYLNKLFYCENNRCYYVKNCNGYYLNNSTDKTTKPLIKCVNGECKTIQAEGAPGYILGADDVFIYCNSHNSCEDKGEIEIGFYVNADKDTNEESPVMKCIDGICSLIKENSIVNTNCESADSLVGDLVKYTNTIKNICNGSTVLTIVSNDEKYYPLTIEKSKKNPYTGTIDNSNENKIIVKVKDYSALLVTSPTLYLSGNIINNGYGFENIDSDGSIIKYTLENGKVEKEETSCKHNYDVETGTLTITNCKKGYYLINGSDEVIKSKNDISNCDKCKVMNCSSGACSEYKLTNGGYIILQHAYFGQSILLGSNNSNSWKNIDNIGFYIDGESNNKLIKCEDSINGITYSYYNVKSGYYINGQKDNNTKPLLKCANDGDNTKCSEIEDYEENYYIDAYINDSKKNNVIQCQDTGSSKSCVSSNKCNGIYPCYYLDALYSEQNMKLVRCLSKECSEVNAAVGIYPNYGKAITLDVDGLILCEKNNQNVISCSEKPANQGYYLSALNTVIQCNGSNCRMVNVVSKGYYINADDSTNTDNPIIQCDGNTCSFVPATDLKTTCAETKIGNILKTNNNLCLSSDNNTGSDILISNVNVKYYSLNIPKGSKTIYTGPNSTTEDVTTILVKVVSNSVLLVENDIIYVDDQGNSKYESEFETNIDGSIKKYTIENGIVTKVEESCKVSVSDDGKVTITKTCEKGNYYLIKNSKVVTTISPVPSDSYVKLNSDGTETCRKDDMCILLNCTIDSDKTECQNVKNVIDTYQLIENNVITSSILFKCENEKDAAENITGTKCYHVTEEGYYINGNINNELIKNENGGNNAKICNDNAPFKYYLNAGDSSKPVIVGNYNYYEAKEKNGENCSKEGDIVVSGFDSYICKNEKNNDRIKIGSDSAIYQILNYDNGDIDPFTGNMYTRESYTVVKKEKFTLEPIIRNYIKLYASNILNSNGSFNTIDKNTCNNNNNNNYNIIIKNNVITSVKECSSSSQYTISDCKNDNDCNKIDSIGTLKYYNNNNMVNSNNEPYNRMPVGFLSNGGSYKKDNDIPFIKCVEESGISKCSTYSPDVAKDCSNNNVGDIIQWVNGKYTGTGDSKTFTGEVETVYTICLAKNANGGVKLTSDDNLVSSYMISMDDYTAFGKPKTYGFSIIDIWKKDKNVLLNIDYDSDYIYTNKSGLIYTSSNECPAIADMEKEMVEYKLDSIENDEDYYYIKNE